MFHPSRLLLASIVLLLAAAGCGSGDAHSPGGGPDVGLDASITVPLTRPTGFATVTLVPAEGASTSQGAPTGEFWYRTSNGALEWFIRAQHLTPGRMYRVEITADEQAHYAVASVRADASGGLAGHGVLGAFTDRVCVGGNVTRPQLLSDVRAFRVAIKDDGSREARTSITAPGNDLPCVGNGDGKWDYVLVQRGAAARVNALHL
jgi:hypothetical protein